MLLFASTSRTAHAETRRVGPGQTFATPCAAFAAASDGDTIEIDASGSYDGDVCAIARSRLTIRGVNGRARIDAAGKSSGGKAIWVVQGADTVIEDVELSGCQVPDKNGAGIRQEGRNLTVRRAYFHDNENGILGGADPESSYLVEDSEFANNGAGDGQSHNMYIGEIGRFTLRGSYSHHGKVGHLVKSRALRNDILYNRLTDETGNASYQLDLPQGGASYVIGNLFQKSADASNGSFISYAREAKRNPDSALFVVSNTFVNERAGGTFVAVASDVASVVLRDNVFAGAGTPCDLPAASSEGDLRGDPSFVDAPRYDYALRAGSAAIDQGVDPGTGAGEPLTPLCQYAHPAHAVHRLTVGAIDQGALEYGSDTQLGCDQPLTIGTDAGAQAHDAGELRSDAGSASIGADAAQQRPELDARVSTVGGDAGNPATDAGVASARNASGCHAAEPGRQLWSAVVALLLLARRRRPRRSA